MKVSIEITNSKRSTESTSGYAQASIPDKTEELQCDALMYGLKEKEHFELAVSVIQNAQTELEKLRNL